MFESVQQGKWRANYPEGAEAKYRNPFSPI
jgi:hypothetical protein